MALKKYPVADLVNGGVDLSELEQRVAADIRQPRDVCERRREWSDSDPVPCWWPYCNCGEAS